MRRQPPRLRPKRFSSSLQQGHWHVKTKPAISASLIADAKLCRAVFGLLWLRHRADRQQQTADISGRDGTKRGSAQF
jgi:hypothetical protein